MSIFVDVKITITKGDPKEVLDVVRTKKSVIDLSRVATGKSHCHPECLKSYGEEDAAYSIEDSLTIISFQVKNYPDTILHEFAERFPQHQFTIVTAADFGDDEYEKTFLLKDGKCRLASSRHWALDLEEPKQTLVRDQRWDWDGTLQEGSFDITREQQLQAVARDANKQAAVKTESHVSEPVTPKGLLKEGE